MNSKEYHEMMNLRHRVNTQREEIKNLAALVEKLKRKIKELEEGQIKRRPFAIEDEEYGVMKICPECSYRVIEGLSNYCINCGQAIDWSEGEQ